MVPFGPLDRSITGVAVMPISGVTWPHPRSSEVSLARRQERNLPKLGSGVSIKSVNAVVLRGHEEHIVGSLAGNRHRRGIERLSVDLAVHVHLEELAELRRVYVARCKNRLVQLLAGASIVIVVGQNVLRAQSKSRKAEQGETAWTLGRRKHDCPSIGSEDIITLLA